mgnify:CR=1 FL=1
MPPINTIEIIKITVGEKTIELPSNWIPAQVAREIATSISNECFKKFMDNIMKEIKSDSALGKTSTYIVITSAMSSEMLARIVALLTDLGYNISKHPTAMTISWH